MKVFLIAMSFVLVACNGQKKAAMDENKDVPAKENDMLELIFHEENSIFENEETIIIKGVKQLASFYRKINKTRKPGIPVPEVDFTKELIIIYCSGAINPTLGHVLRVQKETDTQLILKSNLQKHNKINSYTSDVYPISIYRISTFQKEVLIEKE